MNVLVFSDFLFAFIVSLREVLEAALIIGIIASYVAKINHKELYREVIIGIILSIIASLLLAGLIVYIFTDFESYQELIEALTMFIASFILTWMIIWMRKQARNIKGELESKIDVAVSSDAKIAIISLVFFSVAREGAELVLFLAAPFTESANTNNILSGLITVFTGFFLGLIVAITFSLLLFKSTQRLDIRKFFNVTSIILLVFSAGLLIHGVQELREFLAVSHFVGIVNSPLFFQPYDVNIGIVGSILHLLFGWSYDPAFPTTFSKSFIGSLLSGLFGWNDSPSILEIILYLGYIFTVLVSFRVISGSSDTSKMKGLTTS